MEVVRWNLGGEGLEGPERPRVESLVSGNSQGMGSTSPQEPQKDMEGYYDLLQAGSELESTLQREYTLPFNPSKHTHCKPFEGVLESTIFEASQNVFI